jgi:glycosyltransferase involved in cell wall biosynthesis
MDCKKYTYNDDEIVYSIIIPVYNQEMIIVKNIQSIINNTLDNFEIIVILDFCFDNTEKNIIDFLDNYINNKSNLIQIKIFKNSVKPLFETKCDNFGFKNSNGKFCLEIQADMEMIELGYNIQLKKPFDLLNNVIAVSGRCAHNMYNCNGVGKLGRDIEKPINLLNVNRNQFYVFETCNRGPLLLDIEKLKELNYLNEEDYFLDNSDHDLMARAFLEKKYICGYVPIDFNAPLSEGSTRKDAYINCNEYLINKEEKNRLSQLCNNKPGLKKYIDIWKCREPVIYILE